MALARLKTWVKEKLTFTDLNAEFNNLINNAVSFISPLTGSVNGGGFTLSNIILSALAYTGTTINITSTLGVGGTRTLGIAHIQGDVSGSGDESLGQLFLTGTTALTKRLILGFDTTNNQGYVRAVQSGVSEFPLILQPVGSATSSVALGDLGAGLSVGTITVRSGTAGTNKINLMDGTAPTGTLANGISLYSTTGELRVMDAGGTATLLSPHDEQNKWVFSSKRSDNTVLHVDVEGLLRALNTQLGGGYIEEYTLGPDTPYDPKRKGDQHWHPDRPNAKKA